MTVFVLTAYFDYDSAFNLVVSENESQVLDAYEKTKKQIDESDLFYDRIAVRKWNTVTQDCVQTQVFIRPKRKSIPY